MAPMVDLSSSIEDAMISAQLSWFSAVPSALNPDHLDFLSWSLTDFRCIETFAPTSYTTAQPLIKLTLSG